ncbi:phage portal protein [Streptacidiphilus sp. PAMC 29251]
MADPRRIAKKYGKNIPAAMAAGEIASQMTAASPFSPSAPLQPYDGYSRTPRSQNFVSGYNITTRPRAHERVAFDTLKGLIRSYDVAQMCIWHRIDSIRSLEWSLVAKKGFGGDVTDAIPLGMAALEKPDRQMPFSVWIAAWLYDILAYDAGALSRMANRGRRTVGLRVVDGTTIAPLLDYWGNSPEPPAEAYVQFANGLPWSWFTRNDLVYLPFRKLSESPYGQAPLETILLNANTDLRFQQYFLQRFTEGNIPAGFASAPETWTPDQIEQFQEYWDAFVLGDQAAKNQIKWMPGGSKLEWSNEKDFSDTFSLFLMRKTCAAYHVVPSDLGFTESVNRSSGESQADVQHRVGDLPLLRHVQTILSAFLQDDLGLPLAFAFDLGEEQTDRYQQAQADKIYVDLGAISSSDIREMRYGKPEPDGIPVPRFIFTERSGPIPLASLYALAGDIDQSTGAPMPGTELPRTVFGGAEGVEPSPPIKNIPLAEQEFGTAAMPAAPPPQPVMGSPVAKEGAPTVGITSATGITGYDLIGRKDDEDEEVVDAELAKRELASFRAFRKARRRAREWRDFEFRSVDARTGHQLNQAGQADVRKATGEVAVSGLVIRAADTGRVLMLQRALDLDVPPD